MSDTDHTVPDTEPAPAQRFTPVVTRTLKGRPQDLYHFENGFGAAVMHCNGAPGSDLIWFDVDVIRWDGATFRNVSGTPFASRALDVLDSLNESEVAEALAAIKALPVGEER
jgi:hypothetical protein